MARIMKDSGIKWIGSIPEQWETARVNSCFYRKNSKAMQEDPVILSLARDAVKIRDISTNEGQIAESYYNYNPVVPGDLLLNPMDLQSGANCCISKVSGVISPAYINLQHKKNANPLYFDYYFKIAYWSGAFFSYGKGVSYENRWTLNTETLMHFPIILPPLETQRKIGKHIEQKCEKIDKVTKKLEKQIEVLEEYKNSVITEAVTKGLNPSAPMKDSGIFYIPKYNETWHKIKIGYICEKLQRDFDSEGTPLICSNKGKIIPRGDEATGKMVSDDNAMQGIKKGDLAIHGMDTWHGAIAISDYDGKITRVVHVCDSKEDKRFISYYLRHLAFQGVYKLISNGVRENTSDFRSWEKVKKIWIAMPNREEQKSISDYLDTKCANVEKLISQKERAIETLNEYKKSLIYEYVTGKKEVV